MISLHILPTQRCSFTDQPDGGILSSKILNYEIAPFLDFPGPFILQLNTGGSAGGIGDDHAGQQCHPGYQQYGYGDTYSQNVFRPAAGDRFPGARAHGL